MTAKLVPFNLLSDVAHDRLRKSLDDYYRTAIDYTAFQSPSNQLDCWNELAKILRKRLQARSGPVKILEIGAGQTGFANYLVERGLRERVELHVQDVTDFNINHLAAVADGVHIGAVDELTLPTNFDIIFSTYVFEHVSNPASHLDVLWNCLSKPCDLHDGGQLLIFCPRYDFPGVMTPSSRHLGIAKRIQFALVQTQARLWTLLFRKPQFLIQTDLAVFHQPFFRDADAVHWVSRFDLVAWAQLNKSRSRWINLPQSKPFTKQWLIRKFCTVAIEITK